MSQCRNGTDTSSRHLRSHPVTGYSSYEVNGLTITALQEGGDEVTLTTRQDTDGIYNMIKNFFKERIVILVAINMVCVFLIVPCIKISQCLNAQSWISSPEAWTVSEASENSMMIRR